MFWEKIVSVATNGCGFAKTFDNVLRKNAILALVNILETMGQRSAGINGPQINGRKHGRDTDSESPEGQSSLRSQGYGIFHGLAIRNSPQLAGPYTCVRRCRRNVADSRTQIQQYSRKYIQKNI